MGVAVTAELSRFLVTEFDHPEPHTYRWTKLELEFINDRIITAMVAEREACAKVCEEKAAKVCDHAKPPYLDCANAIRKRVNAEVSGAGTASAGLPG